MCTCPFLSVVEGCHKDTGTIVLGQRYIQPCILSDTGHCSQKKNSNTSSKRRSFSWYLSVPGLNISCQFTPSPTLTEFLKYGWFFVSFLLVVVVFVSLIDFYFIFIFFARGGRGGLVRFTSLVSEMPA